MLRSLTFSTFSVVAAVIGLASAAAIAQTGAPSQPQQIRANGVDLLGMSHRAPARRSCSCTARSRISAIGSRSARRLRSSTASSHTAIAITGRAHGPTRGNRSPAETHAADLRCVRQRARRRPGTPGWLVGWCMLATLVASKQPQLVRTLTLAEPGMFELLAGAPDGKAALEVDERDRAGVGQHQSWRY